MAKRLPAVVLLRKERQGFTFPLQQWLGENHTDLWTWDAPIFQHFDRRVLSDVQRRFRGGRAHWSRAWALIALNEWSRRSGHA
jgi:hypothetical protein